MVVQREADPAAARLAAEAAASVGMRQLWLPMQSQPQQPSLRAAAMRAAVEREVVAWSEARAAVTREAVLTAAVASSRLACLAQQALKPPHQLQLLIPTLRLAPHLEAAVLALAVAAASQAAAALHPAVSVWAASRSASWAASPAGMS